MYNILMSLYAFGVWVASHFSEKIKKMLNGEHESFRILQEKIDSQSQYIWFHAASLGEFEQGLPLMERIRAEYPKYKILLTFFSPSGYEVRKNYAGADICCYLPLDTFRNARRFLDIINPAMAFFIKYEFWYNYMHILKKRSVPVYSVSSIFRPDQVFFKWYGKQYARVLHCINHFFVQNEESRTLLHSIGLNNVSVVGDTRFDRVLEIKEASKKLPIIEAFIEGNKDETPVDVYKESQKVFVAGSSWAPDEDIFINYFNAHRDWKLIIAPHVIGEDHLEQIRQKLNHKTVRYTQVSEEEARNAECLIIDCFGLLSSIYHYADISYVGGGFGVGIHNVLEAAVWGKPVIFGPNNKHFREAQGLLKVRGGFEITDAESFVSVMDNLIKADGALQESGQRASDFVASLAGATEKILKKVNL